MAQALFRQGIAVLFESAPTLDAITSAIGAPVLRRDDDERGWFSGPRVLVAHRPEVNGYIQIDVVNDAWPDHMGSRDEPELLGAWSMGHFGPFAYPGSLQRACQHAWHMETRPDALVQRHRAFVRVRLSYAFGAAPDANLVPDDVDAARELDAVHALGRELLDVPGALALFNPNADMLLTSERFDLLDDDARLADRVPIDAWTNTRLYVLDGAVDGWALMDSLGLRQLERTEVEACYPRSYDPGVVAGFVKNVALHVADAGDVIQDGDTLDGPDGLWVARHIEESLAAPPRPVVRVAPASAKLPPRLSR